MSEVTVGKAPSEFSETEQGRWQTNIPGLRERQVFSIRVSWDDDAPRDIHERRLRDIFKALRLGFEKLDRPLDEAEVRARLGTRVSGVAEGQMED